MTTRFQKLHITSRLISANLLQCSQIPIKTLFYQFNSLYANTEMYEAINKLRNYHIIYANFIFMSTGLIFMSYTKYLLYLTDFLKLTFIV